MSTNTTTSTKRHVKAKGVRATSHGQKSVGLQFLVSTNTDKPDADLRKFIRSHVMQGKNKGKTPRPSTKPRKSRKRKDSPSDSSDTPTSGNASSNSYDLSPAVPRRFGPTWSAARLAADVEPSAVEVVLQISAIAKFILFPLEPCVLFERRAENWIAPLAWDPIYLHTMIFGARFYFHCMSSFGPMRVDPHLVIALRLLREKIEGEEEHANISGSTIAAMMSLASHAFLMGDLRAVRNHLEGLCRIITLKGGLSACMDNSKLLIEILRVDIGASLQSGSPTIFFQTLSSCKQIPYPNLKPLLDVCESPETLTHRSLKNLIADADEELSRIWTILSEFSALINSIVESKQRISTETLLYTTSSVMYRLINMHFDAGSANEMIRLGMLAFCSTIFLQWRNFGISYIHLASLYQECILQIPSSSLPPGLWIWMLMIGGTSVFGAFDYGWLRPLLVANTRLCGIKTWDEMEDVLSGFLWIDLVLEKPGKAMFKSMMMDEESGKIASSEDCVILNRQEA